MNTFILLAVSPAQPFAEFFLGLSWARAGSKVQWSDFHAGLNRGEGAAGAAFHPP